MYRKILVPLDGSSLGEQALPIALGIARRMRATVTLLHVLPERRAAYSYLGADLLAELHAMYDQHRAEAEAYLGLIAKRIDPGGIPEIRTVVTDGEIAPGIRRYATSQQVDLIVMTTHGRTGLSRAWLGSMADAVVRQARIPTLLWRPTEPPDASRAGLAGAPFRHVVIPLDGSDEAEAILPHAVALGSGRETRYTLVRVVSPVVGPPSAIPYRLSGPIFEQQAIDQRMEQAREQLHAVADRVRDQLDGADLACVAVVDQHPPRAILAVTERERADLIAMTTHGRRGMRYLLGSVADKVVRGASGGVLLYHPPSD
jgi:nucleotide-binding universal stress UspA family protein